MNLDNTQNSNVSIKNIVKISTIFYYIEMLCRGSRRGIEGLVSKFAQQSFPRHKWVNIVINTGNYYEIDATGIILELTLGIAENLNLTF